MEAKSEQYKGHSIVIEYDQNPDNPRNWDNLCEFHYQSSRYLLGDHHHTDRESINEMLTEARKQGDMIFSYYAYIHSGVTISMGSFYGRLPQGHAEFDSGQCGFIVVRRKKMLEEFGGKKWTRKLKERAEKAAQAELEEFDNYLRGEIYGYIIDEDEDGHSCWGYFSIEDAMTEAKSIVDHIVDKAKRNIMIS